MPKYKTQKHVYKRTVSLSCIFIFHPDLRAEKKRRLPDMLHTRDAPGYPLHGVDIVPEQPKPKSLLRDLVKLWQETKQREEESNRRAEHWRRAYNSLEQDYLALNDRDLCLSCQRIKDEKGETADEEPDKNKHNRWNSLFFLLFFPSF